MTISLKGDDVFIIEIGLNLKRRKYTVNSIFTPFL